MSRYSTSLFSTLTGDKQNGRPAVIVPGNILEEAVKRYPSEMNRSLAALGELQEMTRIFNKSVALELGAVKTMYKPHSAADYAETNRIWAEVKSGVEAGQQFISFIVQEMKARELITPSQAQDFISRGQGTNGHSKRHR